MHTDRLIAFKALLLTNEKTFAIEHQLIKMHAQWGDSIQNKFTKVVWFEYFGYFVCKNAKKQHNMVQILQKVDADKENKMCEIDKDCKCKFSYTWLDKVV